MPSANKTKKLGLNQWLGNEYPKRIDFVDDNEKIDEAYGNIDKGIDDLNKELSLSENAKYTTVNGVKEFECKDGYVDNVKIEGETLVNLCHYPNLRNETGDRWFQRFDTRISGYSTYTIKIPNMKPNGHIGFEVYDQNEQSTSFSLVITNTDNNIVNIPADHRIATIHVPKTVYSEDELKGLCQTSIILPGNHLDKPISYFEGLKSVGQGDKIEVLTYDKEVVCDLSKNTYTDGSYTHDGTDYLLSNLSVTNNYIYTNNKKYIILKDCNSSISFYDINKKPITNQTVNVYSKSKNYGIDVGWSGDFIIQIPPNTEYVRYTTITLFKNKHKVSFVDNVDKKQILTTLRSLQNGVKDKVYKIGDKYYKHETCTEFIYNGEDFDWMGSTSDGTVQVNIKCPMANIASNDIISNIVSPKGSSNVTNQETIFTSTSGGGLICVRLLNTKFSITDKEKNKQYLLDNKFTCVFKSPTSRLIELPNFNPRTFADKTTFLLNSMAIQCESSFEVTNSLGSSLEVMSAKISDLDVGVQKAFQYGDNVKKKLVGKLISQNVNVSTDNSFEDIINNINIGKKWATGTVETFSRTVSYNLDFLPTKVFAIISKGTWSARGISFLNLIVSNVSTYEISYIYHDDTRIQNVTKTSFEIKQVNPGDFGNMAFAGSNIIWYAFE